MTDWASPFDKKRIYKNPLTRLDDLEAQFKRLSLASATSPATLDTLSGATNVAMGPPDTPDIIGPMKGNVPPFPPSTTYSPGWNFVVNADGWSTTYSSVYARYNAGLYALELGYNGSGVVAAWSANWTISLLSYGYKAA